MRGFHFLIVLAVGTAAAPALAAAPAAKPCTTTAHRQFDFWVGYWEVYAKADAAKKIIAHSKIENLYDGCAIRENWMPLGRAGGGSLNTYDPAKKSWHQFWADAANSAANFDGGWNGKAMMLTGLWPQAGHPKQLTRMSYTPLSDGSVEQLGVTSDDNGKSWQPSFDFIYRKAKS
jgi:hypothetical protein